MNLKEIEAEALHLPENDRSALVHKLLISLDSSAMGEISADWLRQAQLRAEEVDDGVVQPVSAEDVRRKAQALLR